MYNTGNALKKLKKFNKELYEALGKPNSKAELLEAIKKYLNENSDSNLLIFLSCLSNAGINYNYIHRATNDDELIKLYDEAITKLHNNNNKLRSINSLLLDRISKLTSREEIINLLSSCNIDKATLVYLNNTGAHNYVSTLSGVENKVALEMELRKKIDYYKDYLAMKEEESLDKVMFDDALEYLYDAHAIIIEFISGNYMSREEYCNNHNINPRYFDYIINIVKKYLPSDYKMYEGYLNKTRSTKDENTSSFINMVVEHIKHGVKLEDNSIRPFDVLDYYLMGGVNYKGIEKELIENAKTMLSDSDCYIFEKFIRRVISSKNRYPQNYLYDMTYTYNINGVKKELSKEEKDGIIAFLKENNIPVNGLTCTYAIRKYTQGYIEIKIPEESTKSI